MQRIRIPKFCVINQTFIKVFLKGTRLDMFPCPLPRAGILLTLLAEAQFLNIHSTTRYGLNEHQFQIFSQTITINLFRKLQLVLPYLYCLKSHCLLESRWTNHSSSTTFPSIWLCSWEIISNLPNEHNSLPFNYLKIPLKVFAFSFRGLSILWVKTFPNLNLAPAVW